MVPEGVTDADTTEGGAIEMICLDSKCPYCRDGHHCAFVETDDLPCMIEDD